MEPNQSRRRLTPIAVLIFLLLATAASAAYLIYKYKSELNNQSKIEKVNTIKTSPFPQQSIPQLNTGSLLPAKVGEKYQGEVLASLSNANEDLTIDIEGLPNELTLEKCSQEFNTKLIPAPNTQTKCVIEGIPNKIGVYHLKITATYKYDNGYNTVEDIVDLTVAVP